MGAAQQVLAGTSGAVVTGQQVYTYLTDAPFTWVCPPGVTSVSVVCVAYGSAARGGCLGYKNNITVVPGNSYTCRTPASGFATYFNSGQCSANGGGMTPGFTGDGGGFGGQTGDGGGGAAGYAGNGGDGGSSGSSGTAGTGGAAGGGGSILIVVDATYVGGGGGGVGLLGQGANGSGGTSGSGGSGGSGGANGGGYGISTGGNGGNYGGGAGYNEVGAGNAGISALRIIWPGDTRQFPSTNTADM